MNTLMIGVIVYVVVQFAVGVIVSRKIRDVTDFVIAGRSLGPVLVTFSVFATFFGAEAIIGTGGAVYEQGIAGAQADPFGYGLAILIVGVVFAGALWRRGLMTFADLFRQRYSPGVETLVVLVLLPGSIFWAAAQIRAFGLVVGGATGLSPTTAVLLAALVVTGYSVLGGLLADAWTDLIQGIAIVIGLVVLAVVISSGAGTGGTGAGLAGVAPERLAWDPAAEGWLAFVESLAIPICGTIVAVEMVSRILGARSGGTAVFGTSAGALLYMAVGLLPVYVALVGAASLPGLDDPEHVIPKLAETYLPPLLQVLFIGALISAILSTVDTVLLASSAQFSHNLLFRILPPGDKARELLLTRLTLVGFALVALGLALTAEKVKDLVETASAAGSSGVVVATVFGLFTRFGGPVAAGTTVVVGLFAWLVLGWTEAVTAPYVGAVLTALLTYVFVALWEQRESKNP